MAIHFDVPGGIGRFAAFNRAPMADGIGPVGGGGGPALPGLLDVDSLMSSPALKITLLNWKLKEITHNAVCPSIAPEQIAYLRETLSSDLPELVAPREEFLRMSDDAVMSRAENIVEELYFKIRYESDRDKPPTLLEFVTDDRNGFNPGQFYGITISHDGLKAYAAKGKRPDAETLKRWQGNHMKTLVFTKALAILSTRHDLSSAIRAHIRPKFPQLGREDLIINPNDFLTTQHPDRIIKSGFLLRFLESEMKVARGLVRFDSNDASVNPAVVTNDFIVIRLPTLSRFGMPPVFTPSDVSFQ